MRQKRSPVAKKKEISRNSRVKLGGAPDDELEKANGFRDTSRGEYVYQKMRALIRKGRYQQGERIREEQIAMALGVSRTPVREALGRLQTRGLLDFAVGRGLIVSELSKQQVLELYSMRELLEGAAARFAAQHATPTEIDYLHHVLKKFRSDANDPYLLASINREFHQIICDAAHNRYLSQSLNDLADALALLPNTTFSVEGRQQSADSEHTMIVESIEKRDPDAAEMAAREHIRNSQRVRMGMLFTT
jgi:DNA-binding GntR family transcriptional regulator